MASLKELRNRIASVKATQKITKAMQMVAAAKLRRAQLAAEASRPYTSAMSAVIANLAGGVSDISQAPKLMGGTGKDKTHLLVVCTAERGLCGAFNSAIARKARDDAHALLRDGKEVKILCVGKKGNDVLRRIFSDKIIGLVEFRTIKNMGFAQASEVGEHVISLFEQGAFDVCTLYYSEFKSVILQIPTAQQLIPVPISAESSASKTVYEYEPEQEALLADLLPRNLSVQIFKALLENAASEQGARMSAMDNATRNAGEMIKKQTLTYNRTRQAMITKELIEIISGAEAL